MLRVQTTLTQAGVDGEQFNGHSFRIGAATSASQAGVAESTIEVFIRMLAEHGLPGVYLASSPSTSECL